MTDPAADPSLRLALHQPDRPHNFGMVLRLAACLGAAVDVVEPAGFPLDDRRIRQGALDYLPHLAWARHADFAAFEVWRRSEGRRLVLLTTRGPEPYHRLTFRPNDVLMLGSEGAGVPETVHVAADRAVRVPLRSGLRSLNIVTAAALVLGEALRQTGGLGRVRGGGGGGGGGGRA